jgi:transcriptional regulator with XRE-family HTH domain
MSARIQPKRLRGFVRNTQLRFQMVRRGWSASDLARESRLSPATISAALAGRPIAAKSLDLIAATFTRVPARQAIDGLIMGDADGIQWG